jgi:hypothetical protein
MEAFIDQTWKPDDIILRFFESLDRMLRIESWLERDRAMIDQLKTIGIEKGKTFDPNERTKALLNDAASEALVYLDSR